MYKEPYNWKQFFSRLATLPALSLMCFTGLLQTAWAVSGQDTDSVEVTVEIPMFLGVEYTGGDVVFEVTEADIIEGSMGIMNQGDVNLWTNTQPWEINVTRTDWEQTEGDGWPGAPERDIWLELKYGPTPNGDWYKVETSAPDNPWVSGTSTGSFTYDGIDWKIKKIGFGDPLPYGPIPPGTYECEVTFTISYTGE